MTHTMTTKDARFYAMDYLVRASTVSQYHEGEFGEGWVYVQGWSSQVHSAWDGAAHLADVFGTEWKRTASGAAARLP